MPHNLPTYLTITNEVTSAIETTIDAINPDKVALLVDENTKMHCLPLLGIKTDLIIEIKSGEEQKQLSTCEIIWRKLTEANFSRKSLLVNLGGGVIGDMGGFVAATYKRGIRFINVPTTLLSQVDASIGGKLGIDFGSLKNHIGVFKNPDKVIIYPGFLNTLPVREMKSGFAEVIKHGLIYDAGYWEIIKGSQLSDMDWENIILKSVQIKNAIVTEDPLEGGLRKILNFGHTLGHAIESHLLNTPNRLLHGEAIALGMILEANLSVQLEMMGSSDFEEIRAHISKMYDLPKPPHLADLTSYLKQDKKNEGDSIKFSLLKSIGSCAYDIEASEEIIEKSFNALF